MFRSGETRRVREASRRKVAGALAVALVGVAAGAVGGCGGSSSVSATAATPDAGAAGCRQQWHELVATLAGRDQQADPSDLATRWTTVAATAQYYDGSATASDCDAPLATAHDTVHQIEQWSAKLRRYDISYRFTDLAPVATGYVLAPLPKPRRSHGTVHRPPSKRQVRRALSTLQDKAALADQDMQPGWDEAGTVDLTDPKATRTALADLAFLAKDSAPYQACDAALRVLERARSFSS